MRSHNVTELRTIEPQALQACLCLPLRTGGRVRRRRFVAPTVRQFAVADDAAELVKFCRSWAAPRHVAPELRDKLPGLVDIEHAGVEELEKV